MTNEKQCSVCNEVKSLDEFYNETKGKFGKSSRCKKCANELNKKFSSAYQKNNLSKILDARKTNEHYLEYQKNYQKKLRLNKSYAKASSLRARVRNFVIKDFKYGGVWQQKMIDIIGTDRDGLISFLIATAHANGYSDFTIDEIGKKGSIYQIDHRTPCSVFDLTQESELKKCFHYSNMQILTQHQNVVKSNSCDLIPTKKSKQDNKLMSDTDELI